jgi:hypothetical protein
LIYGLDEKSALLASGGIQTLHFLSSQKFVANIDAELHELAI